MSSLWKSMRHGAEALGLRLLAFLVPRLPRPVAYQFGKVAGTLAAYLDRPGRRVALSNLEAAFGDRFSAAERARITRESYQQFVGTMIDLFWSPRLTKKNFRNLVDLEGWDEFARTVGPTGPCIIATCHYGNFEWFSLAAGYAGLVATIISQEFKNPKLDLIFSRLRQQSGHQMVPREGAIVRLYKTLRRGGTAAILADLTLHPRQPAVAIDVLGMKMSVTFAHAWLHRRTGLPIVPVHQEPLPGGRCRVVFHPKLEIPAGATDQEIAQLCWDQFEPVVRRNPSPWLWMYKYWRFRPTGTTRAYPSYAHKVPRFDQLVAGEPVTPVLAKRGGRVR
ncbi:MAG: lysophospholipid acyltransferase family protein [Spartobacteria bacterium]